MLKLAVIQWFSQAILSSQTIHYSFHFLSLPNPTPSNLLHIPPFIPLIIFLLIIKWQNSSIVIPIQSPLLILCSGCAVHVSKSFEHPIHSKSTFSIQFPSFLPKCIPYSLSNPTLFHTSQTSTILSIPFTFLLLLLLLSTLPTSLHLECCATPFTLLFQQRNAHYHTAFFNSSNVTDSSFFFMFLLIHWRITSWNKQYFPAFNNLYSSS